MKTYDPYDLVIVGAGPAGLSAARTSARLGFSTLVVERHSGAGELGHPCSAVLIPASGFVSGRPLLDGLFFPQIDLWVPDSLIRTQDSALRCYSPGGYEFQTLFSQDHGSSTAIIDKPGLLQLLAHQAETSGADYLYGTEVLGLLRSGERVTGVRTTAGDIPARIVLSGEGASRFLCEQASLYAGAASRFALVITQELEAPAVRASDLGRVVMLGQCAPSLPAGFGSLTLPTPGRAVLTYTMFVDDLDCAASDYAALHLDACIKDSRVGSLLADATVLSTSWHSTPLQDAPFRVVADGFMGIGDAITPAGHLGILPAMFLGRQAALIAAEALDADDVSESYLAPYEQLFLSLVLPQLQAEANTTVALTQLSDREVDRLSQLLNWLHLPVPFFGYKRSIESETVRELARQCLLDPDDWSLLKRVMPGAESAQASTFPFAVLTSVPYQAPAVTS